MFYPIPWKASLKISDIQVILCLIYLTFPCETLCLQWYFPVLILMAYVFLWILSIPCYLRKFPMNSCFLFVLLHSISCKHFFYKKTSQNNEIFNSFVQLFFFIKYLLDILFCYNPMDFINQIYSCFNTSILPKIQNCHLLI